jgi:hypothetical protein
VLVLFFVLLCGGGAICGDGYRECDFVHIVPTIGWARLEAEARKMIESGLEFADRIEAA